MASLNAMVQNYKIELRKAKSVNITCGGIAMNLNDLLLYTYEDMDKKLTDKVQGMAGILDGSEKWILMLAR